ncbi:hypothetical protein BB559_003758 [Furculomyces boomerangus]|uniref:SWIM-type domain-containing protein n=1 Tax=Furculomyces boomerangus TaxID=61424 RepID=A0A2T9YJ02_9FUNG|nr:hypothetical protein BB559_003758 [Furculomyces boomerangus]
MYKYKGKFLSNTNIYVDKAISKIETNMAIGGTKRATCGCNYTKENRIPCPHICGVILLTGRPLSNYIDYKHTVAAHRELYNVPFIPVDTNELTTSSKIQTPIVKKLPGQNKKRRIRSRGEVVNSPTNLCSICENTGHNKRTCRRLNLIQQHFVNN